MSEIPDQTASVTSMWSDLISGRRRGLGASLFRGALSGLVPFYGAAIATRNWLFDRGWRRRTRVDASVISIGNLTAGGTGKTPTVAWVVRTIQALGKRPAMISRGYGGDGESNDEKLLLDQLLPGVPHLLNPRRVDAATSLLSSADGNRPEVIVLDDAFQHRQLERDFDLVLIDTLNPWGHGHLLPRGLLREPPRSLARAHCVLLTRCDQAGEETLQQIEREVRQWTAAPMIRSRFAATGLINTAGETRPIEILRTDPVAAFSGIGNPNGFRSTLAMNGVPIADDGFRVYPDHHRYCSDDLTALAAWGSARHVKNFVVTQKDLVKIPDVCLGGIPLWALQIELRFDNPADGDRLGQMLRDCVCDTSCPSK